MQCVRLVLPVGVSRTHDHHNLFQGLWLNQELKKGLVFTEFIEDRACVDGHVDVIGVLARELVDEVMDDHCTLLLQHLLHLLLLRRKLFRLIINVIIVDAIPRVLLLRLNLLLDQFYQKSGQRMVIQVSEQAIEYLALLVDEQILKSRLLLLVQQLFHDLQEIASQNWLRVLVFVQEVAQGVH